MVTVPRLAGFVSAGFAASLLVLRPAGHVRAARLPPRARRFGGQAAVASPHGADVHQRRAADPPALLSELPSARHAGADVAADLRGSAAMGALHQDQGDQPRDAAVAYRSQHRRIRQRSCRSAMQEVATIAAWVDRGAPQGNLADAPPAKVFPPSTEWTYGEPDLVVRMAKGFKIPASRPRLHSRRARRSRPDRGSLRQVGADHSGRVARRASCARLCRSAGRRRS